MGREGGAGGGDWETAWEQVCGLVGAGFLEFGLFRTFIGVPCLSSKLFLLLGPLISQLAVPKRSSSYDPKNFTLITTNIQNELLSFSNTIDILIS